MPGEGTVTVRVIGNVAGLKTAMSEAESTTKGAMDRVGASADKAGGHFSNLRDTIKGVVGVAAGFAAFDIGAHALSSMTDEANADQKAMTTLLQAMQQGGEQTGPQFAAALKDIQEKGSALGFSAADTTNALAHMREAGISTAQGMSALPAIYDLARAKGLDLDTATRDVVLGMQGQGRALKDLNVELPPAVGSTTSLLNAQQKYNDAVAKYGENSKQAQTALQTLNNTQRNVAGGTEYLDQVTQALEDRLGGQAVAATQTASGAWQSFTTQLKDVGGQIMGNMMPAISAILQAIGPIIITLVQQLAPAITNIVTTIAPVISSIVQAFIPALNAILPAISRIMAALAPVINTLVHALAPAFTMIVQAVAPVIAQMVEQLAPTFTKVITALAPLITDLLKDFLPIWKDLAPLLTPILQLLGEVLVPILEALDKIIQALNPVFQAFGNVAKDVFGGVISAAEHVWDFFKGLPGAIGDIFGKVGQAISAPFRFAFDLIADLWNNTLGRIHFKIPGWVPGLGGDEFGFPTIPKMHRGGIVPGNPGDESLAILTAGERVTPASQTGDGINVTVYAMSNADPAIIGSAVARGIRTKSRVVYA